MKKSQFATFTILFMTTVCSFGQVTNNNEQPEIIQSYSITSGQQQITLDKNYYLAQIEDLKTLIQAIDEKVQYVKNDPESNSIALSNGWYQNMEDRKKEAREMIESYEAKIKTLK